MRKEVSHIPAIHEGSARTHAPTFTSGVSAGPFHDLDYEELSKSAEVKTQEILEESL